MDQISEVFVLPSIGQLVYRPKILLVQPQERLSENFT